MRDIVFRGKKTFGDFHKSEEAMATNILAARLEHLVSVDILKKEKSPEDARKDIYTLTPKGLDLIPILFEFVLWSAKYDPLSEAKRIPRLVELIERNNRKVSLEAKKKVSQHMGIVKDYL